MNFLLGSLNAICCAFNVSQQNWGIAVFNGFVAFGCYLLHAMQELQNH